MTTVRIPLPFANTGTVTPIDVTRTDGVVNLQQGYTDDYSRELGVDPSAKAVERDKLNYLFNLITANLQDWQLSAVPQWLSPNTYAVNAFVRYTPTVGQTEKIYRCIANAPSGATPLNTSYWEEVITVSAMKALIPMIDSGVISAATDFNGVARGWWSITDPAVASGSANSPSGQPGVLACYRWGSGAGTAQQVYYAVDGTTYSRGYNGATWSTWKSNAASGGVLPVSQGGTGVGSVTVGNYVRGNGTNPLVERTPAQVLGDINAVNRAAPSVVGTSNFYFKNSTDTLNQYFFQWDATSMSWKTCDGTGATKDTVLTVDSATGNISLPKVGATLSVTGSITAGGTVAATGNVSGANFVGAAFIAPTVQAVITNTSSGPTGGGSVVIRPTGATSSANQTIFNADGTTTANGTYSNQLPALSNSQFSQAVGLVLNCNTGNTDKISWSAYRGVAGSGWQNAAWRIQRQVDASLQCYLQFGGADGVAADKLIAGAGSASWSLSGTTLNVTGSVVATGGFQNSDRRFKKNIKRRNVTRGLALALAKMFREWDRKDDGEHDVGLVAQLLKKIAPQYVREFMYDLGKKSVKRFAIDKSGVALEGVMDNALDIEQMKKEIARLTARVRKLEK